MTNSYKNTAIKLRKQGLSYKEIQKQIPVAKSTLSNWLSDIQLTKAQKLRILELGKKGRKRGNYVRKQLKASKIEQIQNLANNDLKTITKHELWLIGISLYWAEGNKQRTSSPSQRVKFSNSNPCMIRLFIMWLDQFENISPDQLIFELYLHESQQSSKLETIRYWSEALRIPAASFDRIYLKKTASKRTYTDQVNHGLVRLVVPKSTNLSRKFSALADTICKRCGIV